MIITIIIKRIFDVPYADACLFCAEADTKSANNKQ